MCRLPEKVDSTPNVLIYFIDSQYLTVMLLFETIFLKNFLSSCEKATNWIQDLVSQVNKFAVGRFLQASQTQPIAADLTESLKTAAPDAIVRQNFQLLFDRLLLVISIFSYAIMLKKLMPEGVNLYPSEIEFESSY